MRRFGRAMSPSVRVRYVPIPTLPPPALQPQNEHIELAEKRHGRRRDAGERARKKEARAPHVASRTAQKTRGIAVSREEQDDE